jgi:hypothetical protein
MTIVQCPQIWKVFSFSYYALVMAFNERSLKSQRQLEQGGQSALEAVMASAQAGADLPRKVGVTLPGMGKKRGKRSYEKSRAG